MWPKGHRRPLSPISLPSTKVTESNQNHFFSSEKLETTSGRVWAQVSKIIMIIFSFNISVWDDIAQFDLPNVT